ncbi:MAG: PASTA domain-containing protein [Candidatus Eremiobacterota bacterium]
MATRRLAARYDVLELLGEGGMSRVYRGRDVHLGREVAIKIPRAEVLSDPESRERFFREGRAAASLRHPNIVALHDLVVDESEGPFLVMELVGGQDLRGRLSRGPLPATEAVAVIRQVLAALAHAHSQGLVHRDLSARNILLDRGGQVKVSDFGIARALGEKTLTRTGEMVGSVSYMAPEQAQGQESGPTADVYSVGVLLFEMLTGRLPYTGDTPVQVALKHIQEPIPLPSQAQPGVPPALDGVVRTAMAKAPQDRFQSALEMDQAVDRAATGRETYSPPESTLVRAPSVQPPPRVPQVGPVPPAARGPWLAALLGVVAVVCVALGMIVLPPPMVTVPGLVGLKQEEARRQAEALGLRLEVEAREESPSADPDTVLRQSPAAGEEARRGEVVLVTLAVAPGRVTLPDLVGQAEPVAVRSLESLGLKPDIVREEHPSVAAGKVIRHTPAAGQSLERGGTVSLVISTGAGKVALPNLVGMTRKEAETVLGGLGLRLAVNGTRQDASAAEDMVLEQKPSAGTMVTRGGKVGVILSAGGAGMLAPDLEGKSLREAREIAERAGIQLVVEGPAGAQDSVVFQEPLPGDPLQGNRVIVRTDPSVVVPNLSGLNEDQARVQLEQLGLRVGEVRGVSSPAPEGEVVGQDPDSGIEAPRGTEVNLYVSDPDAPPLPEPMVTPVDGTPPAAPWVP